MNLYIFQWLKKIKGKEIFSDPGKIHEIQTPVPINKVFWNTAKLIRLCLVYGLFGTKQCWMVVKEIVWLTDPKIFIMCPFTIKILSNPVLGNSAISSWPDSKAPSSSHSAPHVHMNGDERQATHQKVNRGKLSLREKHLVHDRHSVFFEWMNVYMNTNAYRGIHMESLPSKSPFHYLQRSSHSMKKPTWLEGAFGFLNGRMLKNI